MKLPPLGYFDDLLDPITLPKMAAIRVQYDDSRVEDVGGRIREELENNRDTEKVRGKTVALAVGSRGLKNLSVLVKTTITVLQEHGANVFIVPAMGSHGGATAEGQAQMLEHLGISEQTMGVPVRSCMEPVIIGHTEDGVPVYFDANAASADYTVTIARVKPHTAFRGRYESGMVKMNVIGLGKQRGADYCHFQGMNNMPENLVKIGKVSLERSNLLLSLCVIENAYDETCKICAISKRDILDREPALLKEAAARLPQIPFKDLDVLIVDEIGKNITGGGMDPNIIHRFASEHMKTEPITKRLVVLDLTDESGGNATGAGLADVTTRRFFDKIEAEKAYVNILTARVPASARLPMIMDNDEKAIKAGVKLAPDTDLNALRILRIRNTLCMSRMEISEALLEQARENSQIQIVGEPEPFRFGKDGTLEKNGCLYA